MNESILKSSIQEKALFLNVYTLSTVFTMKVCLNARKCLKISRPDIKHGFNIVYIYTGINFIRIVSCNHHSESFSI